MVFIEEVSDENDHVTDVIVFSDKGIHSWEVWSSGLESFIALDLQKLKTTWGKEYAQIEERLVGSYQQRLQDFNNHLVGSSPYGF